MPELFKKNTWKRKEHIRAFLSRAGNLSAFTNTAETSTGYTPLNSGYLGRTFHLYTKRGDEEAYTRYIAEFRQPNIYRLYVKYEDGTFNNTCNLVWSPAYRVWFITVDASTLSLPSTLKLEFGHTSLTDSLFKLIVAPVGLEAAKELDDLGTSRGFDPTRLTIQTDYPLSAWSGEYAALDTFNNKIRFKHATLDIYLWYHAVDELWYLSATTWTTVRGSTYLKMEFDSSPCPIVSWTVSYYSYVDLVDASENVKGNVHYSLAYYCNVGNSEDPYLGDNAEQPHFFRIYLSNGDTTYVPGAGSLSTNSQSSIQIDRGLYKIGSLWYMGEMNLRGGLESAKFAYAPENRIGFSATYTLKKPGFPIESEDDTYVYKCWNDHYMYLAPSSFYTPGIIAAPYVYNWRGGGSNYLFFQEGGWKAGAFSYFDECFQLYYGTGLLPTQYPADTLKLAFALESPSDYNAAYTPFYTERIRHLLQAYATGEGGSHADAFPPGGYNVFDTSGLWTMASGQSASSSVYSALSVDGPYNKTAGNFTVKQLQTLLSKYNMQTAVWGATPATGASGATGTFNRPRIIDDYRNNTLFDDMQPAGLEKDGGFYYDLLKTIVPNNYTNINNAPGGTRENWVDSMALAGTVPYRSSYGWADLAYYQKLSLVNPDTTNGPFDGEYGILNIPAFNNIPLTMDYNGSALSFFGLEAPDTLQRLRKPILRISATGARGGLGVSPPTRMIMEQQDREEKYFGLDYPFWQKTASGFNGVYSSQYSDLYQLAVTGSVRVKGLGASSDMPLINIYPTPNVASSNYRIPVSYDYTDDIGVDSDMLLYLNAFPMSTKCKSISSTYIEFADEVFPDIITTLNDYYIDYLKVNSTLCRLLANYPISSSGIYIAANHASLLSPGDTATLRYNWRPTEDHTVSRVHWKPATGGTVILGTELFKENVQKDHTFWYITNVGFRLCSGNGKSNPIGLYEYECGVDYRPYYRKVNDNSWQMGGDLGEKLTNKDKWMFTPDNDAIQEADGWYTSWSLERETYDDDAYIDHYSIPEGQAILCKQDFHLHRVNAVSKFYPQYAAPFDYVGIYGDRYYYKNDAGWYVWYNSTVDKWAFTHAVGTAPNTSNFETYLGLQSNKYQAGQQELLVTDGYSSELYSQVFFKGGNRAIYNEKPVFSPETVYDDLAWTGNITGGPFIAYKYTEGWSKLGTNSMQPPSYPQPDHEPISDFAVRETGTVPITTDRGESRHYWRYYDKAYPDSFTFNPVTLPNKHYEIHIDIGGYSYIIQCGAIVMGDAVAVGGFKWAGKKGFSKDYLSIECEGGGAFIYNVELRGWTSFTGQDYIAFNAEDIDPLIYKGDLGGGTFTRCLETDLTNGEGRILSLQTYYPGKCIPNSAVGLSLWVTNKFEPSAKWFRQASGAMSPLGWTWEDIPDKPIFGAKSIWSIRSKGQITINWDNPASSIVSRVLGRPYLYEHGPLALNESNPYAVYTEGWTTDLTGGDSTWTREDKEDGALEIRKNSILEPTANIDLFNLNHQNGQPLFRSYWRPNYRTPFSYITANPIAAISTSPYKLSPGYVYDYTSIIPSGDFHESYKVRERYGIRSIAYSLWEDREYFTDGHIGSKLMVVKTHGYQKAGSSCILTQPATGFGIEF